VPVSKDASFELYLHRGLLFVGSTGDPWDEPDLFATPSDGERPLTAVPGHGLPAMTIAADEDLSPATELGLILSTHDLPRSRLAAAIKLLLAQDEPAKYGVAMIVDWLRWLHPHFRAADCRALGEQLLADLAFSARGGLDERSLSSARGLLGALNARAL
jgi:hypothetical protein